MTPIGILGLGTYLPPAVRTNDHWPANVVAGWADRMAARATRADAPPADMLTAGVRRTLAAMAEFGRDPFRGSRERRAMADDTTVHQMEAAAARDAIRRAGLRVDQIDAILTQTPVPENLFVNSACVTHQLLELPRRCFALATECACNGFAMHVALAQGLIASGQARHVLSIQSSAMTRITRATEPDSPWWGDGAAAAVIGPVGAGKGLLAARHHADGRSCDALVLGVEGQHWWQDGAIALQANDRDHTRAMLLTLVDRAGEAIAATLADAGAAPADVEFYASHQGTVWFTRETAAQAGLAHAKTIATFPTLGNMNSVNIPMILALAERDGLLRDGALVSTFAGGVGETWSSLCLRWGR